MDAIRTAAEMLGVTPAALESALNRGETIESLARACGLDPDRVTRSVVAAEVADVRALAMIAGFDDTATEQFAAEMRAYLVTFAQDGGAVADARFDGRPLVAA